MNALQTFTEHESGVEDVEWHKFHGNIFGSVGDDRKFLVWDVRENKVINRVNNAHEDDVNCLSFSPFQEFHVATGGSDSVVKLWDMRKIDAPFHTLEAHKQGVYQVAWSPFNESVLASSSEDRRLVVWDISRIGQEQSAEDAQDGPPELLFVHGGHTAKVFDFSWNQNEHWFISSVAEDNVLQIWQMASNIYEEDDDEDAQEINDEDLEGPVTKKPKL